MVHEQRPINPLPFIVAIWAHLNPMVVGREGAYGVGRGCVWGGKYANVGGELGARYIIRKRNEERKSNYFPQVQHVEQILLAKHTLIAAIPPKRYSLCSI